MNLSIKESGATCRRYPGWVTGNFQPRLKSTLGRVGFWRNLVGLDLDAPEVDPDTVAFSASPEQVGGADIDPAVFGLSGYTASTGPAPRIDRRSAMQCAPVKRARDLIAGSMGGLPLDLYDAQRRPVHPSPFDQPERHVPRSVTMTRLYEDLLFEGIAWWEITESDYRGFPLFFKRLRPGRVVVDEDRERVFVNGKERDQSTLIRFDSPTDGLLIAGARAIRTLLALDIAAANNADGVPAVQYFTPTEGADPAEDDEITELLNAAQEARRRRGLGYIPASLKLIDGSWDPEKLQLADQRQHAVLEIARHTGVDAEDLQVSMTSRTYNSGLTRRQWFIDMTAGLYRQPVEDRLSMGDVTPRGQYVKSNLDVFLRSDAKSRYEAYAAGKAVGALDDEDIARLEDRPAVAAASETPTATVTALPARTA